MESLITGFPELFSNIAYIGEKKEYGSLLLLCKASYTAIKCEKAYEKFVSITIDKFKNDDVWRRKFQNGKDELFRTEIHHSSAGLLYSCNYVDSVMQNKATPDMKCEKYTRVLLDEETGNIGKYYFGMLLEIHTKHPVECKYLLVNGYFKVCE
jgi:hypothetical protein